MVSRRRQPRWTPLIGSGLRLRLRRRVAKLNDVRFWTENTARIQVRQLRRLLRTAQHTRFGQEHEFARLARLRDSELVAAYRKAVPVADYYAFRASVAEMREEGRPDVLWPGVVKDFAQTSGTTAGDKYIPVSKQMLRSNMLAALDIFAHAERFGVSLPFVLGGKVLFLGGSTDLSTNDHGVRTGDLSGLVAPLIRWPISRIYSPGRKIALMNHWPSKIEAMAQATIDQDVRMINGMPSWGIVLFERVLELARQRGMKAEGIKDVWKNLTIFVHGGVKYAPFESRVRQAYSGSPDGDDIPFRLELYPASEGFIAIQDTRFEPGLRLLSDIGNFYEFIPLDRIDDALGTGAEDLAFTCDQVRKGVRYVVTMSTCAGLWRYVIGDVVEFDSIPSGLSGRGGDGPCRLRIVGRHRHFINAFGENLIVEHIENAVAAAAKRAGVVVGEFTAAPVYPGPGVHAGLQLAIEVVDADSLPQRKVQEFGDAFDAALKQQNVDYTTKRTDDLGMHPPTISPLPMGTFHRWLAAKGKLGGQHKCPRCANHREIISEILAASR